MNPSVVSMSVVSFKSTGSSGSILVGVHSLSIRKRYLVSAIELFPSASIIPSH